MVLMVVFFHLIPKNIINISFLFPFFLVGYYSKNIASIGWKKGFGTLVLFVLLFILVWNPEYTIWRSGGYILQNTGYMIKVMVIRLIIGMLGIYAATFILGKIYDLYKNLSVTKMFEGIGKETLSIYLLQHIVVEIGLMWLILYMDINQLLSDYQILFGYVIAPVVSLILLWVMYQIVVLMQKCKTTKWMFGFRVNLDK